jgi:hypothetical protein
LLPYNKKAKEKTQGEQSRRQASFLYRYPEPDEEKGKATQR